MNKSDLKKIIKNNDRYKDFTLLETPVRFKDMQADNDIQVVQLHSIESCGENDIVGFCGAFSWINNTLASLDGDSYSDETLVYGYDWFKNMSGDRCLDILVEEW